MAVLAKVSFAFPAIGALALGASGPAFAQHITIDGRFSPAQTLVGPNYTIGANLGKQVGSNLFHSFGQFTLSNAPVPESATFTSTGSTGPLNNVIGRVTGGSPSSIDGAIRSTISGANLYLINPNGVIFGPHATVNVSGGFHTSTADYLKMSDGAKFQATNPDGSTLSAAPPAAFGFLNASPAKISVNGSTLGPVPGTLGLVGGPVSITGGTLSSPAGTVHVTSAAGIGEVPVDPRNAQALTVTSFGPVGISGNSKLDVSNPSGLGSGGSVFIRSGSLTIDASEINGDNYGSGPGGQLLLRGNSLVALSNHATVHAVALGAGAGASVAISAAPSGSISADAATVLAGSLGPGNAGALSIEAGQLTLTNGAALTSLAQASGNGGTISVAVERALTIDGTSAQSPTGILSLASDLGNAGVIVVSAGGVSILSNGEIASVTSGAGKGGAVAIDVAGSLAIDGRLGLPFNGQSGGTGIISGSTGSGKGGSVTVTSGSLTILNDGTIASSNVGSGSGGSVSVKVAGAMVVDGTFAPLLPGTLPLTGVATGSLASGDAGVVSVIAGTLTLRNNGTIASGTQGTGKGGSVTVDVAGALSIDGASAPDVQLTGITSQSKPLSAGGLSGDAGAVTVNAGSLSILSNGGIASATSGPGKAGSVSVNVAGPLSIDERFASGVFTGITSISLPANPAGDAGAVTVIAGTSTILNNGVIASGTLGSGKGGPVSVIVAGSLSIDGRLGRPFVGSSGGTGITSGSTGSGSGGPVAVTSGTLTILNDGTIASGSVGSGAGGSVSVKVDGAMVIDGAFAPSVPGIPPFTGVTAGSLASGDGGVVAVTAGTLTLRNNGTIATGTQGTGKGGNVTVDVAGALSIDGTSAPDVQLTGITSQSKPFLPGGPSGDAGTVTISAGSLSIIGKGGITSPTFGSGSAGNVTVTAQGSLILSGPGSGIVASATSGASGRAGSVTVKANNLTVEGGAQIASSTAGPGSGGDVNVIVASDITLPDRGPQITAQSTGSGDAGSITVKALRLLINDGGAISTEAETSTANGGNITLKVSDFLYLTNSQITTSVKGETGNGGNITIDPQLVILNHSSIIAQAVEGHGGDITINAGLYVASTDSIVSASSQRGISGMVLINGPQVDVNSALVVLSSELHGLAAVSREACAARANQPVSSLVEAGRGGQPQDPEATLPALYIADRDLNPTPASSGTTEASRATQTTVRLTMRCG